MCRKGLGKVKNRNTLLWIVILLTVYKNVLQSKELRPPCWEISLAPCFCSCVTLGVSSSGLRVSGGPTSWPLTSVWSSGTIRWERERARERESAVLPSGRLPQWVVVDPTVSLQVWGRQLGQRKTLRGEFSWQPAGEGAIKVAPHRIIKILGKSWDFLFVLSCEQQNLNSRRSETRAVCRHQRRVKKMFSCVSLCLSVSHLVFPRGFPLQCGSFLTGTLSQECYCWQRTAFMQEV